METSSIAHLLINRRRRPSRLLYNEDNLPKGRFQFEQKAPRLEKGAGFSQFDLLEELGFK